MLLSLSLDTEILRSALTNFTFKKLLSHEALVRGRVRTLISNLHRHLNAALQGDKNNEIPLALWVVILFQQQFLH